MNRLASMYSRIESMIVARLCILAGFVEQDSFAETAAPKAVAKEKPKHAPYRGAERKINKPPKMAMKIFSTDNPFNVPGLKYAEFQGKGIEHAAYDEKTMSLWISFSGQELLRWYWYKDVLPEDWDKFRRLRMNAIVYFNKEIRPIHDYALVEKTD